ncbi:MAG: broad-spectrum mercury transporter MerE [Gemmatimonadaceae bacterium]
MRYLMAAVAVLACPCHLPIWLALLSGTALAGVVSDHLGFALVPLTLLFVVSAWAVVRLFSQKGRDGRDIRFSRSLR